MNNLFFSISNFSERVAIVSAADGRATTYGELCALSDGLFANFQSSLPSGGRPLIYIEAANELSSLLAFVGAGRKGLPVILLEPGTENKQRELREKFPPYCEYRKVGGEWIFTFNPDYPDVEIHPDLGLLLSTSGSTGSTKLVRLSKDNVASNAEQIRQYLGITPEDRAITTLPYFYSYGLSVITSHLLAGASIVLCGDSVIQESFWEKFDELRVTSFAGVPRTFDLLEHSGFLQHEHKSLRYFTQAGGRLPPEKVRLFADYAEKRGKQFFVMYGQTEASPRISYMPPELLKNFPDCIGVPMPGAELRLQDDAGNPVEVANQPGEMIYSGPNVMMGYASGLQDFALGPGPQVLHTGDIAIRNDAGLFKIVGRKSRFVKISGLRLSLDTIEENLRAEGIQSIVTGDDELIAIAIKDGKVPDGIEAMLESKYKIPPGSLIVMALEETPLLGSGKIDYQAIIRRAKALHAPAEKAGEVNLRHELARILRTEPLKDDDTFANAGGDSINFMEAAIVVEKYFGYPVAGWQTIPMLELEEAKSKGRVLAKRADSKVQENVETLRGLACVLLVMYHVVGTHRGGIRVPDDSFLRYFVDSFVFIRMPLFTFLSGFVFAYMPPKSRDARKYFSGRARRFLLPLLFVGLPFTVLQALATGTANKDVSLWQAMLSPLIPVNHYWYLQALLLIFTLVGVASMWFRARESLLAGGTFAVACLFYLLPISVQPNIFSINGFFYLLPYFCLGWLVHLHMDVLNAKIVRSVLVLGVMACFSMGIVSAAGVLSLDAEKRSLLGLAFGIVSCLGLYAIKPNSKMLTVIGASSFSIYLFHSYFSVISRTFLSHVGVDGKWVMFFSGVMLAIAGPMLLERLIDKLPPVFGALMYGRAFTPRKADAASEGRNAL